MTQYGTWVAYAGPARITLAIGLLVAAAGVAYAARRLPLPARLPRPGRPAAIGLVAAWAAAIAASVAGLAIYVLAERHDHIAKAPPSDPITPVTIVAAGAVFVIILILSTGRPRARLASAVVAAIAGPMIFELPFDLIVMARTYPPVAPDPALYRLVFFAPLFLVEITTLLLLSASGTVRLTRPACLSLALMLVVFAAWAADGFGYPAAPFPIAMNVLSKLLAFAVVLGLCWPARTPVPAGPGEPEWPARSAPAGRLRPAGRA
jgi:hypothetical protein